MDEQKYYQLMPNMSSERVSTYSSDNEYWNLVYQVEYILAKISSDNRIKFPTAQEANKYIRTLKKLEYCPIDYLKILKAVSSISEMPCFHFVEFGKILVISIILPNRF